MAAKRILLYVQHLLGIGHQRRAATLARTLCKHGMDVLFVSGGHEVPNLRLQGAEFAQLPPTRATDLYFKELVDEDGVPIDDDWRDQRRQALLNFYQDYRPHGILIELFPFGRRQMRFELVPLLESALNAENRPVIMSSVRDILVGQHKPERNEEMLDRVQRYFDYVFVHGDPDFIPFNKTFPYADAIAEKLIYTGYVVDQFAEAEAGDGRAGQNEVLVSAGGGAVGQQLLETAMRARPLSQAGQCQWRFLAGVNASDDTQSRLRALAAENRNDGPAPIVEPSRGDFPALLKRCRLSISQAGYNTLMELMAAKARAVVVPYAGGIETEQTLRAKVLQNRTPLQIVAEAALTPTTLAAAIDRAWTGPGIDFAGLNIDGAAATARHMQALLADKAWP